MTCMEDILENISNVVSNPPDFLCMGTNSGNIFQNICKRKKIIQVWNDTRVSKRQNFHSWVIYPFKKWYNDYLCYFVPKPNCEHLFSNTHVNIIESLIMWYN